MLLKILRKKGTIKKILWIIILGIIAAFGIAPSFLMSAHTQNNYAGKIFGQKISLEEYNRNLQLTEVQAIMQYGANFQKIKSFLNLDGKTWDRIILLYEANKKGIKIDDTEVIQTIQAYPFFQRDGAFNQTLYKDIVEHAFRVPSRRFEEGVRDSLKIARLYGTVTAPLTVSEDDILKAYQQKNQKIQISYIYFPSEEHQDKIIFDESKAKEYYEQHKQEFQLPEMVNVEYIRIDYPEKKEPEKSPGEKTELSVEEKDATHKKALTIADQLAPNPDFAQVAQANNLSADTSGFFSLEKPNLQLGWPFPLIKDVFQMEIGKVSSPIETIKGYQILRVKEKKEAHTPAYEEAQEQVKAAWIDSETKKMAKAKADENFKTVQKKFQSVKLPDFARIAKDLKLEIEQTPVFTRGQYLPKIGIGKDFQDTAFSLTENNRLSDVVEAEKGYCILHLDSILPVDMAEYAKQKGEFSKGFIEEQKNMAFNDFLTHLRLKASLEDKISELRKKEESSEGI